MRGWMSESVIHFEPGNLLVEVEHDGRLVREEVVHNKVTSAGRNVLRDLMLGIGAHPNWIAVGTTSTAAADTDVALGAEYFRAAVTRRVSSTGKAVFKLHLTTSDANGSTIREVGLFAYTSYSGSSPLGGGQLFARAVVAPIVKDNTIQVTFTWEFPITSS